MKTKTTIIFVVFVLIALIVAVVLVPRIFPKNTNESSGSFNVQTSEQSTVAEKKYTISEMIAESDNVIVGTVIKVDVDENGVLYTMTVSWRDVYKGRNYATMGYAYVKVPRTLELNKSYLFIGDNFGDTKEEKYHYKEPFENAPWVFEINDDKNLIHISNGKTELITDLSNTNLETIKNICKSVTSGK